MTNRSQDMPRPATRAGAPAAHPSASGLPVLPATPAGAPSALERLGPAPFLRGRFPFLGFLATVYDHVSAHARQRLSADPPPPPDEASR